ncbi:MAG: phosphatase PAP2 family protein [Alphaproteobacteria bacterium]|nr:phosphatase PAP2 family protein [Alphaproteobacteria bacterium]
MMYALEPFDAFAPFDRPIQVFLTQFTGRFPLFDDAIYLISELSIFKGMALFSLLWLLWFYKSPSESAQDLEKRRESLLVVFIGTLAAAGFAQGLQDLLSVHIRPIAADLGLNFSPRLLAVKAFRPVNSFPSDHAVYFCALATGFWKLDKRIGLVVFLWTILGICIPRVYLGVHYPSDIVAGCLLGVAWMLAFDKLAFIHAAARRILVWGKVHQALFYWFAFLLTANADQLFDDIRRVLLAILATFGHNVHL